MFPFSFGHAEVTSERWKKNRSNSIWQCTKNGKRKLFGCVMVSLNPWPCLPSELSLIPPFRLKEISLCTLLSGLIRVYTKVEEPRLKAGGQWLIWAVRFCVLSSWIMEFFFDLSIVFLFQRAADFSPYKITLYLEPFIFLFSLSTALYCSLMQQQQQRHASTIPVFFDYCWLFITSSHFM